MSTVLNIFGEHEIVRIECANDEPCIWIRTRNETVSFSFTPKQMRDLRAALDTAEQMEVTA